MTDRTIIVTGASDGIGAAAARALHNAGDHVVVVGRSAEKTRAVASEIGAEYLLADYGRLDDVRALAASLLEKYDRIDVLANNAGGIMGARELTVDGYEKTLQVNHLAPFLLTTLLLDRLTASRATVVNTASVANVLYGKIDIDDLQLEKKYSPNLAYGNGKLANILFTKELDRRYAEAGISTAAFHPGIVRTNFASGSTSPMRLIYQSVVGRLMMSPARGADTLVWLASTEPGVDWVRGEYYAKRKPARKNTQADDAVLAAQLWQRSAEMVANG
jgi:NAD(P)-dependent dehydrogenase (short-subunit alcohol dehydrogenase family)